MDVQAALELVKKTYQEETTKGHGPAGAAYRRAVDQSPVVMAVALHMWADGFTKTPNPWNGILGA